ncbi:hypothetical protein EDC96DRAFT_521651 [Choanephora cucurbitarum]|nr:hypothetical protein EDC96DRAFT_521651 [Choanephora cucurbitarum]
MVHPVVLFGGFFLVAAGVTGYAVFEIMREQQDYQYWEDNIFRHSHDFDFQPYNEKEEEEQDKDDEANAYTTGRYEPEHKNLKNRKHEDHSQETAEQSDEEISRLETSMTERNKSLLAEKERLDQDEEMLKSKQSILLEQQLSHFHSSGTSDSDHPADNINESVYYDNSNSFHGDNTSSFHDDNSSFYDDNNKSLHDDSNRGIDSVYHDSSSSNSSSRMLDCDFNGISQDLANQIEDSITLLQQQTIQSDSEVDHHSNPFYSEDSDHLDSSSVQLTLSDSEGSWDAISSDDLVPSDSDYGDSATDSEQEDR